MRFVELKSQDQLDMQTLHRSRDRLVGERTALISAARHSAGERVGRAAGQVEAQAVPERADGRARRSELEQTHDPARRGCPRSSIDGSQPSMLNSSAGRMRTKRLAG